MSAPPGFLTSPAAFWPPRNLMPPLGLTCARHRCRRRHSHLPVYRVSAALDPEGVVTCHFLFLSQGGLTSCSPTGSFFFVLYLLTLLFFCVNAKLLSFYTLFCGINISHEVTRCVGGSLTQPHIAWRAAWPPQVQPLVRQVIIFFCMFFHCHFFHFVSSLLLL